MNSIRKWLYRPKKSDNSLLAQFYFVDEDLNLVASELDSFDGRKDPERCTMLVNQLRVCQDKVLQVIQKIMDDAIGSHRANRDFRVKFPDDVLQDSLSGQLWFGAECLAAGSSILNREVESASMRPLARALTKNLDSLRNVLREQCLKSVTEYTDRIREALTIFDKLFAEFELSYVSAMVPVKTMKEYDMLQEVTVLFSETVQRALTEGLLTQDMLDDYDPALMFTIPRLAIVCGLLVYPEGPLNPDMDPTNMTEMFRPFQTLLFKIRELLYTLNIDELCTLEKALCSNEEPELSKTPLAGQGLENLQIDQGFDEGGEGIVSLDILGSDILMSATSSSSPRTPVNTEPDFTVLDSVSTTSTIMDAGFRFSSSSGLNLMDSGDSFAGLNKSESQDSGLHSENISTSDSVTMDVSPSATNHDLNAAANTTEVQSINKPINSSKRSPDSSRKTASIHPIESISEHIHDSDINDSNLCDNSEVSDRQEENEGVSRLTEEGSCVNLASAGRRDSLTHEEVRYFCQMLVQGIIEEAIRQYRGASVNNCDNGSFNALNEESENICEVSNSVENKEQMTEGIPCEMKANAINCDTESINEGSVKVTSPSNESANFLSEDSVIVPTQENGSVNSSNEGGGLIVSTPDNGSVNAQNESDVIGITSEESNCDVNADQPAPGQTDVETETRAAVGLSRQFSWQYNIQLASHNYSLLEAAGSERSGSADGGSISSNSTLSDQGTQDSVTDFVVETLSAMNQPRTVGNYVTNQARPVGNSATSKSSGPDGTSEPQDLEATLIYKDKDNEANSKNYKNISNRTKQILMKKNVTPSSDESVAMATNATNSVITARSAADSPKYISKSQLGNKTTKQKSKMRKDRRESLEHINCKTGPQASTSSEPLDLPVIKALRDEDSSSYSSCQSTSSECSRDKDCSESETSSCTSENNDEEEIALAIEAAELASRNEARSRFRSSSDLIHRLFVCIAGVADQLQTNYASDLRHILKCVFELNSTNMEEPEITPEPVVTPTEQVNTDIISSEGPVNNSTSGGSVTPQQGQVTSQQGQQGSTTGQITQQQGQGSTIRPTSNQNTQRSQPSNRRIFDEPPEWEPDSLVERCTSCKTPFTFVRRRHHCRNCGKIFCGKCSSTTVPLPQYGHQKPVRVCHNCFIYQIAHFTMQ